VERGLFVGTFDGTPKGEVAGTCRAGRWQEAVRRPRPDAGTSVSRLDLVVGHLREDLVAETTVDERSASARSVSPLRGEKLPAR
jgi:hypothetical protein